MQESNLVEQDAPLLPTLVHCALPQLVVEIEHLLGGQYQRTSRYADVHVAACFPFLAD